MGLWTLATFLLTLWGMVYLADALMRRLRLRCYERFLKRTELTLGFFYAKLYILRTDEVIPMHARRVPNRARIALNFWFTAGVFATCILGVLAVRFLTLNIIQLFKPSPTLESSEVAGWNKSEAEKPGGLVAIIPGVNMPWCHVPLLFFVLALCAIIHELGHAIAALNEDISVDGFGLLFFVIYPGAFTDLNGSNLKRTSAFKKLKVYCAGVWHNLCLSAVASLLLRLGWRVGVRHGGVMFQDMHGLPLGAFPHKLMDGEIIYSISGCSVASVESWLSCLEASDMVEPGRCLPAQIVHNGIMNQPSDVGPRPKKEDFCFYFRLSQTAVTPRGYVCVSQHEIITAKACGQNVSCTEKFRCIFPGLLKTSRLFYLELGRKQEDITFVIASVKDLYTANVTERLPVCGVRSHVDVTGVFLQLTAALSFAFALLNAVPCFGLDGYYLVDAIATSLVPHTRIRRHYIVLASQVLSFAGTCLIVVSILVAILPYLIMLA